MSNRSTTAASSESVTRNRFSDRKHEQPVAGTAKSRTQAHVVTQADEPVKVTAPFKTSTKKHKTNGKG